MFVASTCHAKQILSDAFNLFHTQLLGAHKWPHPPDVAHRMACHHNALLLEMDAAAEMTTPIEGVMLLKNGLQCHHHVHVHVSFTTSPSCTCFIPSAWFSQSYVTIVTLSMA